MGIRFFVILLYSFSVGAFVSGNEERADWGRFFDDFDAEGSIVVVDGRTGSEARWVFDHERAEKRFSPASTFKVPHTLFALDSGALRDEFQVFPWDGVERTYPPHNQDQTLRSAMRHSALWVYDILAEKIGEESARGYLEKISYGNADPSTETGSYWVEGKLAVSVLEQVSFLEKLYRNELPFKLEHQRLVKDVMIVQADRRWILRAKTGWEGRYGWWVGWVEWQSGPVFFALNIDTPNRMEDLYKREAIVRKILESIEALPGKKKAL